MGRRSTSIRAGVVATIVCACGTGDPVTPPPNSTPLPGIHALSAISQSLPDEELEPFAAVVGDATFVALGESTHTSAGFYQAKVRLIRFLVEQLGFRVVALESAWLEGRVASDYVASCAGTPNAALSSLTTVWRDANVRELLTWMCTWNQAHPADPVTFFGFDVQEPWSNVPAIRAFLTATAPAHVHRADSLASCIGVSATNATMFFGSPEYQAFAAGQRNTAAHQRCVGSIDALEAMIASDKASLTSASSATAVAEAEISLIALRAWEDQLWIPDPGGYAARDYGMAESIKRLHALYTPGKKTVVWAWNWHIARRYEDVRGWDLDSLQVVPRQTARAMGSHLHDWLGAKYLPVGLIGYKVETIVVPPTMPASPLSVELRLHNLEKPYLLVDLRTPAGDTLLSPGRRYSISQEWADPYQQFGALLFLDHSPRMTFIAGGPTK